MQERSGSSPPQLDWEKLLLVWLHDPVDKALDVPGHEARAARLFRPKRARGAGAADHGGLVQRLESVWH